jgi:hypothetical protein
MTGERFCVAAVCHAFLAGDDNFVRQQKVGAGTGEGHDGGCGECA